MRTSSSVCGARHRVSLEREAGERREKKTHDPGEDKLEASHVRHEDVGEHLLVVPKHAFEVQRVVGLLVRQRTAQAPQIEG